MSNENRGTDLPEFIHDLDAGVFAEKVARALGDVAAGVVDQNKGGEVTLKFNLTKVGNSPRVNIKHKLSYKVPEMNGSFSQENTTESVMHVNPGGRITQFPENQHQMFGKRGESLTHQEDKE